MKINKITVEEESYYCGDGCCQQNDITVEIDNETFYIFDELDNKQLTIEVVHMLETNLDLTNFDWEQIDTGLSKEEYLKEFFKIVGEKST